jgi:hypothetical protein
MKTTRCSLAWMLGCTRCNRCILVDTASCFCPLLALGILLVC